MLDRWNEGNLATLKVELIHRMKFMAREEAKRMIFEYVEMYYNRKRAHSTLGYLSPFEFEKKKFSLNNMSTKEGKVTMKQIVRKTLSKIRYLLAQQKHYTIFRRFKGFTMIPRKVYIVNLELADRYSSVNGAVVECGTWKGGMIAVIASLLGSGRNYYLYDSFQGLPQAKEIDGEPALRWQANKTSPHYFDNCTATEQTARSAMELAGVLNSRIEKGWFKDTLPIAEFPEGIAIIRMDADWYDSTTEILNHLFKSVNKGGVIIIDDYHTWDGCSRAVHDFLSKHQCVERINVHKGVCFIEKA